MKEFLRSIEGMDRINDGADAESFYVFEYIWVEQKKGGQINKEK